MGGSEWRAETGEGRDNGCSAPTGGGGARKRDGGERRRGGGLVRQRGGVVIWGRVRGNTKNGGEPTWHIRRLTPMPRFPLLCATVCAHPSFSPPSCTAPPPFQVPIRSPVCAHPQFARRGPSPPPVTHPRLHAPNRPVFAERAFPCAIDRTRPFPISAYHGLCAFTALFARKGHPRALKLPVRAFVIPMEYLVLGLRNPFA